ncbi:DcaP family trimeric outer membrane transporter [Sulfurimonas marina]|uniref:Porin n=1 Tax=Sulfurimonas marina TaxID=2590551 RepID=A0A7M1AUL8_9BACT|nr:DcaP family trimeric outer membrane transporter [Sulfurimonas marina]QOP41110.1 hypothetical protein FJR03_04875 [Sulfurimonas marina]
MFKSCSRIALAALISTQAFGETSKEDVETRLANLESWMQESKQQKGSLELKTEKTVLSVGGRVELLVRGAAPTSKNIAGSILKADSEENMHLNFDAANSRVWVKTKTPSNYGMIRTLIETDFAGSVTGTQANTNSSGLRLRHAYVQVGNWTVGQTNSAFNSVVTLDIIELPINDMLVRQPLIRYTFEQSSLSYDISFEQPETTLRDENGTMVAPQDDILPDLVLRARYYPKWGEAGIAFLGRYINQEEIGKDSAFGWGTNISAKFNVGSDDIRIGGQYGVGLGRYIAYNSYATGSMDAQGNIKLQATYGGDIGYRHWWTRELRSTLSFAFSGTKNNDEVQKLDTNTKEAYTTTANLLWSPVLNSLVGLEYTKTKLKAQSGLKSDLDALTLCLRYDF